MGKLPKHFMCTGDPRYLRTWHMRFWLFEGRKTGKTVDIERNLTNLSFGIHGSKVLWNVTLRIVKPVSKWEKEDFIFFKTLVVNVFYITIVHKTTSFIFSILPSRKPLKPSNIRVGVIISTVRISTRKSWP